MPKRYFAAYVTFDDKHLRSNVFFHSGLIFFEANQNLIDIRATGTHGFL